MNCPKCNKHPNETWDQLFVARTIEENRTLKAELYDKTARIQKLEAAYREMERALFDIGSRAKPNMTPMELDMKRVATQALLAAKQDEGNG